MRNCYNTRMYFLGLLAYSPCDPLINTLNHLREYCTPQYLAFTKPLSPYRSVMGQDEKAMSGALLLSASPLKRNGVECRSCSPPLPCHGADQVH